MKKRKNIILLVIISILFILSIGVVTFRLLQDENKLTINEKKYITDNKSNLITVNILNNSNIFGDTGEGVFYDFIDDAQEKYGLNFNIVGTNDNSKGLSLTKGTTLPKNSKLFYTDHYVLIGKKDKTVINIGDVTEPIGYITNDSPLIGKFFKGYTLTLKNYEDKNKLVDAFKKGDVDYILVPNYEYMDVLLDNLYSVVYHLTDIKDYYYMISSDANLLTSIMTKYHNIWEKELFKESFNKNKYKLFIDHLKITEKELDVINSKEYNYGFIENKPYEIKTGGSYGGIIDEYLEGFEDFSGVTINKVKYNNIDKLYSANSKKKVDLYVDYYNLYDDHTRLHSLYTVDISFVMNNNDNRAYASINSIGNEKIYIKEDTLIYKYLKDRKLNVIGYKKDSDLKKIFKSNNIVAMDRIKYLEYTNSNSNVSERFVLKTNKTYDFISKNDTMFNRLFTYFTTTIDKNEIMYLGYANYSKALKSGTMIYKITRNALLVIIFISVLGYIFYKLGKRVHIKKKIKKVDKMRYIDMLTSLKNRNFLSENLTIWNQNTIYPQAIIVIDLNGIQELNDSLGYQEGDKQIQAAANALIKTQLDNTEIMRTDGNEFTVYMIGYTERQVLSYIKKLNKQFKNLPHDKGACIGFSMIQDDLKLIDDAINEATERMKENKKIAYGDNNEKKL